VQPPQAPVPLSHGLQWEKMPTYTPAESHSNLCWLSPISQHCHNELFK